MILIASDHAGFDLKSRIIQSMNLNFKDLGPQSADSVDYPDYARLLCQEFLKLEGQEHFGILICGSGQGMAMTANRFPGIRAALCWNEDVARLSRQHNNANILCLGSRVVDENLNLKIIKAFLETPFEGGRHQRRVEKI